MAKKFDDFGKLYAYVMKNAKRSAITATKNVTRRIKDDMYKKALENVIEFKKKIEDKIIDKEYIEEMSQEMKN